MAAEEMNNQKKENQRKYDEEMRKLEEEKKLLQKQRKKRLKEDELKRKQREAEEKQQEKITAEKKKQDAARKRREPKPLTELDKRYLNAIKDDPERVKEFKEKLRKNNYILEDEPVPAPKKEKKTVGKNDLKTGRKTVSTTTSIDKIKPKNGFTK